MPTKDMSAQLSVAVGTVQVAVAPQLPTSALSTMLLGMPEITGFSVSGEHWAHVVKVDDPRKSRHKPREAMKRRIGTEFGTCKLLLSLYNQASLVGHNGLFIYLYSPSTN